MTPEGRSVKKKSFKAKNVFIKLRCSNFEKKLLKVKAKKCGLTLSEYIRKVAFKEKITERLTDEHIDMYKITVLSPLEICTKNGIPTLQKKYTNWQMKSRYTSTTLKSDW